MVQPNISYLLQNVDQPENMTELQLYLTKLLPSNQ